MAIKYRASWNASENEALIQFDFIEDRGASGSAQVFMPRSTMELSEQKQAEEAFKRFLEIHAADLATDERLKQQQGMTEVTSKALMELTFNVFRVQSEVAGLKKQISDLKVPDEPEEVPDDARDSQDETEVNEETEGDPDMTEELPSEPADTPEETEEPNEIIDEV